MGCYKGLLPLKTQKQKGAPGRAFPYMNTYTATGGCLLYLLLERIEFRGGEEFAQGDIQPVAKLFDGGDARAVVPPAYNIVHGGLRNAAHTAQSVDGNIPRSAQLYNAIFYSFTDTHCHDLRTLLKMIPISS